MCLAYLTCWVFGVHMVNEVGWWDDSLSCSAQSCFKVMAVCQQRLVSDSGTAVQGSLQQPASSTAHIAHQDCPPPPAAAEGSSLKQPPCINPHPCAPETTGPRKPWIKRKADEEDGVMSKRAKFTWHRYAHLHQSPRYQEGYKGEILEAVGSVWCPFVVVFYFFTYLTSCLSNYSESHAGPSISSSSWDPTDSTQASAVVRSCPKHSPNTALPLQHCTRPGKKRKRADGDDVGNQHKKFRPLSQFIWW